MRHFSYFNSLLHTSSGYDWDDDFGVDGRRLRELIGWYRCDEMHSVFKASTRRDLLMSGIAGAVLLLHWGDAAAAQADWRARADDWRELARLVRHRTLASQIPSNPMLDPIS